MSKFEQALESYLEEASDSLRQWFKRGGTDPKTGKKFKGWVNCKTGGPCGRKSKKSGGRHFDMTKNLLETNKSNLNTLKEDYWKKIIENVKVNNFDYNSF